MDLSFLNDRQREAVLCNGGCSAVLSSAGSGKTRTITTKISYLVNELNVMPSRIWACTFTNKASNEMKVRLKEPLGSEVKKLKLSTIHSTAYAILKQAKRFKEPWFKMPKIMVNDFPILMHLYKFCKDKNLSNGDAKGYLQTIANLKLDLVTVKNFRNLYPYETRSHPDDRITEFNESLHIVYKEYIRWMGAKGYMDFQDMLVQCYETLEDPKYSDFRENLAKRCEYILVDEAQDTNTVSFKIIDIMAEYHKRVTIVGDTRQLIYSFQGARMENIHNFIKKYDPKLIDLNINYRSTSTIVENANKLISYATDTIGEPAITPNGKGDKITHFTSNCQDEESFKVLDLVQTLKDEGNDYKDIAILYRIHSQAILIEDQFMLEKIPFISSNKTSFYRRKEIVDLTEYVRVFMDPDKMSGKQLKRIANRPTRFISNKTVNDIQDFAFEMDKNIWEACRDIHESELPFRQKQTIDNFFADVSRGRKMYLDGASTAELFQFVIKNLGYEDWAIKEKQEKEPDVDLTLNFDTIVSTVSYFKKPEDFLSFLVEREEEEKRKKDENGDYVKLMSIHASKGKEFKIVIILGLCDRIFPFYKAVQENNEAEERRVMYVGITRPEKKLYLSALNGTLGRYKVKPSPYLYQMNADYTGGSNDNSIISDNTRSDFFKQLSESLEE